MVKVLISIPTALDCRASVKTILWGSREPAKFEVEATSEPAFGRNLSIIKVLDKKPDITHILFADSDTEPPDGTVIKLLSHNKDIVAGAVPTVHPRVGACWGVMAYNKKDKDGCNYRPMRYQDLPKELFKARYLSGSSLMISRRVMETMDSPYFNSLVDARKERIGEDIYFCIEAIKKGFELWCDPTIQIGHRRPVDLLELFKVCWKQFRS